VLAYFLMSYYTIFSIRGELLLDFRIGYRPATFSPSRICELENLQTPRQCGFCDVKCIGQLHLFRSEQDARSRCEPVHFPTERFFLPGVRRNPDQLPVTLAKMDPKLE
jgi:hypothetical protein